MKGQKFFNSLPKEVRGISDCSVKRFKTGLDKFHGSVPNEATLPDVEPPNTIPAQLELTNRVARGRSRREAP